VAALVALDALQEFGAARVAELLERVERDEIGHVRVAVRWFEELTGRPLDYRRWRERLPAPLTPAVLQGRPLNHRARLLAGLDDAFLAGLRGEPATNVRASR